MRPANGVATAVWRSCRHGAHARWCTGERPRRRVMVTLRRWPTTADVCDTACLCDRVLDSHRTPGGMFRLAMRIVKSDFRSDQPDVFGAG